VLLKRNVLRPNLPAQVFTWLQWGLKISIVAGMLGSIILTSLNSHAQTTTSNANAAAASANSATAQNPVTAATTTHAVASNNGTPSSTATPNISSELGQLKADFSRQLAAPQIQQGSTQSHVVLWLDHPAMTPFQKGNVILLPDQSQHAASPRLINFLRQHMPDFGWHTRAMQVPALPATANDHVAALLPPIDSPDVVTTTAVDADATDATAANDTGAANGSSSATTHNTGSTKGQDANLTTTVPEDSAENASSGAELLEYQQQLAEQLSLIVAQQRSAGATIIIAEGSSAAVVNHLIKNNKLQNIGAVILISAYIAAPKLNADAALAMAQHNVPVLDISFSGDNRFVLQQQHYRAQLARKYIKELYRQRQITSWPQHEMEQQWVWKEIYGWLSHIGY